MPPLMKMTSFDPLINLKRINIFNVISFKKPFYLTLLSELSSIIALVLELSYSFLSY